MDPKATKIFVAYDTNQVVCVYGAVTPVIVGAGNHEILTVVAKLFPNPQFYFFQIPVWARSMVPSAIEMGEFKDTASRWTVDSVDLSRIKVGLRGEEFCAPPGNLARWALCVQAVRMWKDF